MANFLMGHKGGAYAPAIEDDIVAVDVDGPVVSGMVNRGVHLVVDNISIGARDGAGRKRPP